MVYAEILHAASRRGIETTKGDGENAGEIGPATPAKRGPAPLTLIALGKGTCRDGWGAMIADRAGCRPEAPRSRWEPRRAD